MGTNILKKIIALSLIASMLLVSGCAGNPRIGQNGEQLVWIQHIRVMGGEWTADGNITSIGSQAASMATSSPIQAGLVGALIGIGIGMAGASEREGKIHIVYSPDGSRVGKTIYRKPWPGASELQPKTWAILSSDENGRMLLPCLGCEPVKESN